MSLDAVLQAPGRRNAMLVSVDGNTWTYRASISNVTPAATPSDIFQLVPGTTRAVRIKRYKVEGFAATAGFMPYRIERRSTANTGAKEVLFTAIGGSAPNVGQHDRLDPASDVIATGTAAYYSSAAGNPSATGSVVSVLDAGRIAFPSVTVGLGGGLDGGCDEFIGMEEKALIFRGALDIFAISLTGAAVPTTGKFDLMVEWEETLPNDLGLS